MLSCRQCVLLLWLLIVVRSRYGPRCRTRWLTGEAIGLCLGWLALEARVLTLLLIRVRYRAVPDRQFFARSALGWGKVFRSARRMWCSARRSKICGLRCARWSWRWTTRCQIWSICTLLRRRGTWGKSARIRHASRDWRRGARILEAGLMVRRKSRTRWRTRNGRKVCVRLRCGVSRHEKAQPRS